MKENSLKDLREFFSTPDRPVSAAEFATFWKSCTDEQKTYYKNVPLS